MTTKYDAICTLEDPVTGRLHVVRWTDGGEEPFDTLERAERSMLGATFAAIQNGLELVGFDVEEVEEG